MSATQINLFTTRLRQTAFKGSMTLITGGIVLFGTGCSSESVVVEKSPVVRTVKTYTIDRYADTREKSYLARVRAPKEIQLGFEVGGRVEELETKTGVSLEAGEVIARLDLTRNQLNYDQAAEALAYSEKELGRMQRLHESGSGTEAQLDRVANSNVLAKIAVEKSQKDLKDSVLRAPFNGQIARRLVEKGSFIGSGQPIVVFQESGVGEVEFYQTESQLRSLVNGLAMDSVEVRVAEGRAAGALLTLKDYGTTPDPLTGAYRVTMNLRGVDTVDFLPGAPLRISVVEELSTEESLVNVPADALVAETESSFRVWLVMDDSHLPVSRAITVGAAGREFVEVTSGLKPGDRIVTSGASLLRADSHIVTRRDS